GIAHWQISTGPTQRDLPCMHKSAIALPWKADWSWLGIKSTAQNIKLTAGNSITDWTIRTTARQREQRTRDWNPWLTSTCRTAGNLNVKKVYCVSKSRSCNRLNSNGPQSNKS